jgi:hypothetical protein
MIPAFMIPFGPYKVDLDFGTSGRAHRNDLMIYVRI